MFHLFCSRLEGIVEVTMVHFSFILELCVCVCFCQLRVYFIRKKMSSVLILDTCENEAVAIFYRL